MNANNVLTAVDGAIANIDTNMPNGAKAILLELAELCKAEIRLNDARGVGKLDATKAALRIMKTSEKTRRALAFPWTNNQGRQCFMDGFHAFRLTEPLALPERPADAGEPIDLDGLIGSRSYYGDDDCLPLPSAADVRVFIAEEKAKFNATYKTRAERNKAEFVAKWHFGEGLPYCNAEYLLDVLTIMGDDVTLHASKKDGKPNLVGPIHFVSKRGDGILLPIRVFDDANAPKQAEKPKDPDVADKLASLNERLTRARKDADEARKYLSNFAESCKRCAAMYPDTWSISPDEFADMVQWRNHLDTCNAKVAELEKHIAELNAA